ncbi:MAG: helix-turn-helix domain-containing protein [Bdellovibrionota bacterium]
MKTIAECLGENVKRLRQERDLTQGEFAKRAKLSISFLQNIESGKKWVGPKTITTLAKSLKVSETDLFRDCSAKVNPEPKDILLVLCRSFGFSLDESAIASLKVRNPPSNYSALYDSMPEHICVELTALCQKPKWDWEKFRKQAKTSFKTG